MPVKELTPATFQQRIIADPAWYAQEVFGIKLWDKPIEIVRSVLTNRRTAVRGCVGSGKTHTAALAVCAFMHAYPPAEVYTTAPTFRQVKKFLWKEIRKLYIGSRLPLSGKLLDTEWKIADDWFAMGFSSKDPDSVHGAHAKNILVVLDEGQGIQQEIIDASENALAGGNAHLLMLFNPNTTSGEAYECTHSKANIYHNIKIAASDTPNVKEGRTIIPGMIEKVQVDEWVKTFGWDSNFVRVKVRSEYPRQEADALIPIEWIEAAMNREARTDGRVGTGVDCARTGDDNSVIGTIRGRTLLPLKIFHGIDTMRLAGEAKREAEAQGSNKVCVDIIGLGAGVYDRMRELRVKGANEFNGSRKSRKPRRFANMRSEAFWAVREALDPKSDEPLALAQDLELAAELSVIKYDTDSQGRIVVEDKDEIKKRIKRSPDRADCLTYAVHAVTTSAPIPGATVGGGGPLGSGIGRDRIDRAARDADQDDEGGTGVASTQDRGPRTGPGDNRRSSVGGIRRLSDRFGMRRR